MNEPHDPQQQHEVDEQLRAALGRHRAPDLDTMEQRMLAAIREEKSAASPRPVRRRSSPWTWTVWAIAACLIIVLAPITIIHMLDGSDEQPDSETALGRQSVQLGGEFVLMHSSDTPLEILQGIEVTTGTTMLGVMLTEQQSADQAINADALLGRTDPESILLTNQRHLVMNDPNLRPHTIWEQPSLNDLNGERI